MSTEVTKPVYNITPLTDDDVIIMRRMVKSNKAYTASRYAREQNRNVFVIEKALNGKAFKHLNIIEPPITYRKDKAALKEKARALFQSGSTYNTISAELDVAKSTLSYWCRDLVATEDPVIKQRKKLQNRKPAAPKPLKGPRRFGKQILTDDQVIQLRRDMKVDTYPDLKAYVEKYKVSATTISLVVRGLAFRHLNTIEPPLEKIPRRPRKDRPLKRVRKPVERPVRPHDAFVPEATILRRQDPSVWTYPKLAQWMEVKIGKLYRPNVIAFLLIRHDSSLKDIKEPKTSKRIKPFKLSRPITPAFYHRECVVCEKMFKSRNVDAEVCSEKACRDIIKMHDE